MRARDFLWSLFLTCLLLASSVGNTAAKDKDKDYSDPAVIAEVAAEIRAAPDGGEAIFDALPPEGQEAYVQAQSVSHFELEEPTTSPVDVVAVEESSEGDITAQATVTCWRTDVPVTARTYLGNIAFTWWLHKYWCPLADGWRINGEPSWWYSLSNVDPNYIDRGINSHSNFWEYWPTQHYTFAQVRIENCVFRYGCFGSKYPEAWIRVYGSTTWSDVGADV